MVTTIEGLSRRKPYVTFDFVIFKIPSFTHVIGFSFIPNIRKIDNKVEERKRRQKKDERISFEPSIERERERERQRERHTHTHTHTQRETERDRERQRERETETESRERPRIFDRAEKPSGI